MQAVVVQRPGGYGRLVLEQLPDPLPGPGEVRLAVASAGVNFADCAVRMGVYASAKAYVGWPITPGFDVAGTVDAVGPGVADLEVGARVLGLTRFGGYATRVVLRREQVARAPAGWGPDRAAAFPTVHLTAWYALRRCLRDDPAQRLLVHSAAGGVGQALCRLARILGHEPIGVVGAAHKVQAARAAGALEVLVGGEHDLWAEARRHAPRGYDAVLDASGPDTLRGSYRQLAPEGRLIVYGFHSMFSRGFGRAWHPRVLLGWLRLPRFAPLALVNQNRSVLAFNLSYLFERAPLLGVALAELLGWIRDGRLEVPEPTQVFPLERAAEAHLALESGRTTGKLALACDPLAREAW